MNQTLDYFIADPAGNTTILVVSPVNRTDYQRIAQLLLEHHPEAEQVGYIVSPQSCLEPAPDAREYNQVQKKAQEAAAAAAKAGLPRMEMCGLEFCGNASRAFGYYAALQQDPPLEEIEICVSGCDYPLHVGITEAGTLYSGNIKSAAGLGIILYQGIGDTIRVSLTGDPVEEIKSARMILRTLGLRKGGIDVVSCPTCGRTRIDLVGLANKVETMVQGYDLNIKVAVMGCAVNGPGEAKEADIGIAGGNGEGLLIKHGQIVRKMKEEELLDALKYELDHWK